MTSLIEEAIWAPSPHNSQPWRFTAIFNAATRDALGCAMARRLAEDLARDGVPADVIERQTARSHARIAAAPAVLLCSLHADGLVPYADDRMNRLEWEMAVQSVGAVLQTLFLLARQQGLGTCWMAAPMYCPDVVRDTLDLPDDYHPQALALMGYPAQPGKVRPRRDLCEVLQIR